LAFGIRVLIVQFLPLSLQGHLFYEAIVAVGKPFTIYLAPLVYQGSNNVLSTAKHKKAPIQDDFYFNQDKTKSRLNQKHKK